MKELILVLMMINVPKIKHQGLIVLGEINVSIVILHDGRRLITKKSIFKLFGKTRRGRVKQKTKQVNTLSFVDAERLENIISTDLSNLLVSIKFFSVNDAIEEGYDISIISQLCNLFLRAKKKKLLKPNNAVLAERSEIVSEELNNIELNHLIDKSFNFGYKKENDEITNILKTYLTSTQLILWEELFESYYYKELFRLNGWDYNILEIKKRPIIISKWLTSLVFNQLPMEVANMVSEGVFNKDIYNEKTRKVYLVMNSEINTILTLLKISNNMKELWGYLIMIKQRDDIIIKSPFGFDENGFTIEPMDDSLLSHFNRRLKKALSFNPRSK